MRVKMSKQPPPTPTTSTVGPCPTIIQIVGHPGTGRLPRDIAPPDHPLFCMTYCKVSKTFLSEVSSENILSVLQAPEPVLSSIDFSAVDTPSVNNGSVMKMKMIHCST